MSISSRVVHSFVKSCRTSSAVLFSAFILCCVCAYIFGSQLVTPSKRVHDENAAILKDSVRVNSYPSYGIHGEEVVTKSPSRDDQQVYSWNVSTLTVQDNDSDIIVGANTNKTCYLAREYTTQNGENRTLLVPRSLSELEKMGCKKRLPGVLTVGVKKCGTGALRFFMNSHPQVMFGVDVEAHYFDRNYDKNIEWYIQKMPYTTQDQISTEKTPFYFVSADVPRRIFEDISPDVKIIMVMCDPVNRAISDFVQVSEVLKSSDMKRIAIVSPMYRLKATFEDNVIKPDGTINVHTPLIDVGLYIKHIRRWLEYFSLRQILVIDGEELKKEPYMELKKIENFLNLSPHFTKDHFYFDTEKGFFCLRLPMRECLPEGKGRHHPKINETVLLKLRKFFKPYDQELEFLLNRTFLWSKV
ncbi:heparan sulfate glucosamine 3-O-sulfotransferase 1-like [Ptychodera flava]|uniref:heparan sulfate glucosamine 3-O-sulfotransferase 1-like n=1 Tax=Ptychodera flava TaxID=63121 RepID=UPI00396A9B86